MAITSDNLKSKRGMVGGAVAALLVAGGVAAVVLPSSSNSSDRGSATTGGEGAPVILAQMGDPGGMDPGGAPMGGPGAPGGVPQAPPAPAEKLPNSFSGAPPTYGSNGAGANAGGMGFGGGGGFGVPTTPSSPADFSKLKPIKRGKVAAGYRKDPFDSRLIPKY